MRTIIGPLVLGIVAFGSYSLKTNHEPPQEAPSSQQMTARPKSHEERKARTTPNLPHEKAADPACTSVHENSLQCAIDDFFGKTPPPVPFHLGENKGKVRFVIATVPDEPLIADHPEIPHELALQGFEGVRAYESNAELRSAPFLEQLG